LEVIVNFHPLVLKYFNELIDTLLYENYFLYRESAIEYVSRLIFLVENQIHIKIHHVALHQFLFLAITLLGLILVLKPHGISFLKNQIIDTSLLMFL